MINEQLAPGMIAACRHANGRDWWMLVPERETGRFFCFLIDPTGVHSCGVQSTNLILPIKQAFSQACFSPDGTRYAQSAAAWYNKPDTIAIYDFDRCTGQLSNPMMLVDPMDSVFGGGGIAFSPNSRYLYKTNGRLFQYDVQAPDIAASKILVAPASYTNFFMMQLGPDGKVYVCGGGGTIALHRIDYPNLPGLACNVCQDCVPMPPPTHNFGTMVNTPNFRLGPVDGSACDTLGLNVGVHQPPVQEEKGKVARVFPNPVSGILTVALDEPADEMSLVNTLGSTVYLRESLGIGVNAIDCQGLAKGLYLLVLKKEGKITFVQKIIKF